MKRLIEFPLDDGDFILVEVYEEESEGLVQVSRGIDGSEIAHKAVVTFQQAMDKVKPAAEVIIKKLRMLSDKPDEIEVQFGLKLSAEAGAFVAAAGVDANYSITLKWKQTPQVKQSS